MNSVSKDWITYVMVSSTTKPENTNKSELYQI